MTAALLTLGSGPAAFADIGVTTAARMIDGSDTIFVGQLGMRDGRPVATRERTLKGRADDGPAALIDPSEGRFLAFNLDALVSDSKGARTVVLGDRDAGGAVRLKWLFGSLWPQGYRPPTFRSDTVELSVAFVERVLAFSDLSGDPDALAVALYDDISGKGEQPPHAALAYLEVAVEKDLRDPMPTLLRALGTAAAAGNRNLDAAAVEQLASLAPMLPTSVAAPLLLDLTRRAPAPSATLARNALWPMLSARGADAGPNSGSDALEFALTPLLPALRRADGIGALAAFDSGLPRLSSDLGDATLGAILGRSPRDDMDDLSPAQRREVWAIMIANLR